MTGVPLSPDPAFSDPSFSDPAVDAEGSPYGRRTSRWGASLIGHRTPVRQRVPVVRRAFACRWTVACLWLLITTGGPTTGVAADDVTPQPLPAYAEAAAMREDSSLHAIAFASESVGVAVGDRGTVLRTDDGGLTWGLAHVPVDCRLDDVIWLEDGRAVVVGGGYDPVTAVSRGVVLVSQDGGKSWRRAADDSLPRLVRIAFAADGNGLIAVGDWSPVARGRAFRSGDGGRTWRVIDAPPEWLAWADEPDVSTLRSWTMTAAAPAAVRGRCRVGDGQLWAVGDHGFIMHSGDGGRTWQPRRGGQRRTSVLIVARRAADVPWPVVARESFEFGRRVAVLVSQVRRGDDAAGRPIDLVRQATISLGGAAADTCPGDEDDLASAAETLGGAAGGEDGDGGVHGRDAWAGALGDWLAIHRPAAVLIDRQLSPTRQAVARELAVRADVPRVFAYDVGRSGGAPPPGDSMLHAGALLTKSGVLARDVWEDALMLVSPLRVPGESVSLRRLHDALGQPLRGDSLAPPLRDASGTGLSAQLQPASRRQLQIAQARQGEPERIRQLFDAAGGAEAFDQAIRGLLSRTAPEDRARVLWLLLREARQRPDRRREIWVLGWIRDELQPSSLAAWAALRLEMRQTSAEWMRLRSARLGTATAVAHTAGVPVSPFQRQEILPAGGFVGEAGGDVAADGAPAIRPAASVSPVSAGGPRPPVSGLGGVSTGPGGRAADLAWELHPAVLVAREAFKRRGSAGAAADGVASPRETSEPDLPTGRSAGQPPARTAGSADLRRLAESNAAAWAHLLSWARPGGNPSGELVAVRAETPPRLDERFDDPCWAAARPATIPSDFGRRPFTMRAAYDDRFVYFAATCPSARLRAGRPSAARRGVIRDHELTDEDRLQLRIDTDRDLISSLSLEMSPGGGTRDSVDGDLTWQPTWYVAPSRFPQEVRFELAVLRSDLVASAIESGDRWLVSLRVLEAGEDPSDAPLPAAHRWISLRFE